LKISSDGYAVYKDIVGSSDCRNSGRSGIAKVNDKK